jgi:DNA-binding NarL/FixJ family response regulator
MRALLVDVSVLFPERLLEMLRIYKHIEIAGSLKNGTETLKALRILKPDLAIVEIKMSISRGLEVLVEISKENKTVKFIILTVSSLNFFRQMTIQTSSIISLLGLVIVTKYRRWWQEWFGKRNMIMESKWPESDMLLIIK